MRMPRRAAEFNRRVTNRAARRVAGWLPTLGVLEHVGRTSGRHYRTPLNVFDTEDGFLILIGYGLESNWVKNALAGGAVTIRKHGRTHAVADARLVSKAEGSALVTPRSRLLYRVFPYDEAALVLTRADSGMSHH
ncbi:nitroreductase family deazaflavin-dependent oxidoreductase [Mycobacterium sp. ACS4331]|uniref:nitroreductase family deazaflavin-dependent oxidoreductase n=1 Tax=Mycobacterium sp. ACS4331 TaxID=1834121 RepID=UPI0007FFFCA8|nr:nitroreductase family deazaflavin-dependent oxidoreductase [Mycobacterium sp. ACS4331]OBF21531.1 peptidase [Mycobacterium sp. ACS4331]